MNKKDCEHEWVPFKPGILECVKCKEKIQHIFSEKEIREGLRGIELPTSYKDMRKMYDENPKYQHVSFETFVECMKTIKKIVDEGKLRFKVR